MKQFLTLNIMARGLLLVVLAALSTVVAAKEQTYDVVVVGGTPAGVAAAIAAGRMGKTVLLVEQSPVLGGMLNLLDDEPVELNSGILEEFRRRVKTYHLTDLADDPVVKRHRENRPNRFNVAEGQAWEPKTAARIFAEMVAEVPTITILSLKTAAGTWCDSSFHAGTYSAGRCPA